MKLSLWGNDGVSAGARAQLVKAWDRRGGRLVFSIDGSLEGDGASDSGGDDE
jgi:hypothetical protein